MRAGETRRRVGSAMGGRPSGTRGVIALALCAALLAGCGAHIGGSAAADPEAVPPAGKPRGYTPSDFPIQFALAGGADQVARDSLDDIVGFYSSFYPDVFGTQFEPPQGGYYSIAPGEGRQSHCMDGPNDDVIVDNAFYCPSKDEVVYWRPLIDRYASDYSDMQVGLVLAHELGHTIQARQGQFGAQLSIIAETQADCFAGTWARSVADGKAPHFRYDPANMDGTLLAWAIELPSEVGSDPTAPGQHGSAFDRVSAMQEGYESGPEACRDNFNENRPFAQAEFSADDLRSATPGDLPFARAVELGQPVLDAYYADQVAALNGTWTSPRLVGAGEQGCADLVAVSYCESANAIVISDEGALQRLNDKFGDFAMLTALSLAYAGAAIVQLGFAADDPNAKSAASCLTGALAATLAQPETSKKYDLALSPGDFDEATVMLLSANPGNPIVNTGAVTAFDRMDAFRSGVYGGVTSCGVSG